PNAIFVPSGDQTGRPRKPTLLVIGIAPLPSGFITKSSSVPPRRLPAAIWAPSGFQAASMNPGACSPVTRTSALPSGLTVQTSYAPPPPAQLNAIRDSSGDQLGADPAAIVTRFDPSA